MEESLIEKHEEAEAEECLPRTLVHHSLTH
jgi:hypothetical protein